MGRKPNVIVLIFDTLRSDHLSCYGADISTPNFDRLAELSTTFESAFAVGPGTPVSHAGLYTGQYPSENGVTGANVELPEEPAVLAEWLRERGYDTYGITGPSKMGSNWGFDRGFDELFEQHYDVGPRPSREYFGNVLTDRLLFKDFVRTMFEGDTSFTKLKFELLQQTVQDMDEPFFALCNFLTAHLPYKPPRPYRSEESPEYEPPKWFFLEQLLDTNGSVSNSDVRLERLHNVQRADGIGKFLADPDYLNDAELEMLRSWYRASVKYLDDELGRFLEYYEAELADDTVLVATADHGEQLGEHGLWEHSHCLFDETMKVPLFVAGPDVPAGERRGDIVSLVDVFDTVCDLCGLDRPPETSGQALFEAEEKRDAAFMEYGARDESTFRDETAQGRYLDEDRLRYLAAGRKGIRTDDHLFVVDSNGNERLYEDPEQELNPTPRRQVVSELKDRLVDELGTGYGEWPEERVESADIDANVEANLRELGYID